MISNIDKQHPSKFMIDFIPMTVGQDNVESWEKNEPGYCEAFYNALKKALVFKKTNLQNSKNFLSLLDNIQLAAVAHLTTDKINFQGRQNARTFFGLSNNDNSNINGIKDIIEKICKYKSTLQLITKIDNESDDRYVLKNDGLFTYKTGALTSIIEGEHLNEEQNITSICKTLITLYNKGICNNGTDRMVLISKDDNVTKESKAKDIFNSYINSIKGASTDEEKIKIITTTIRDLLQLHLYGDGNGRSLYILANILLLQNNLKMFYPKNMCMFDANSVEKMFEEIISGQERFETMFGNDTQLAIGLENYESTIVNLQNLIKEKFNELNEYSSLLKSTKERNFNLLFRQSAADVKTIELFEFLLNNAKAINIDIFSKGKTSGDALGIANRFKNTEAASILSNYTTTYYK